MTANQEIIPIVQTQAITTQEQVKVYPLAEQVASFARATGGRSSHTVRAYSRSVAVFLQWLGKRNGVDLARPTKEGRKTIWEIRGDTTALLDIDLATLDVYTLWLAEQGVAGATVNLRLAAVSSFLSVALRDKAIDRTQGHDLGIKPYKTRRKNGGKTTGRRLSVEEVRALRATIELTAKNEVKVSRDRSIIDLMLFAGLRRSEVAGLSVTDFRQDGGRWWVVVKGKGDKPRRLKIHDTLFKSITDWLTITGREFGNGDNTPLFYNIKKGGALTDKRIFPSVIGRLVAEYGAAAGLAPRHAPRDEKTGRPVRDIVLGPHDLRRTCARNARENGAPLERIQAVLGHSDIATTMSYIGEFDDDADTAIDYVRY